MATLFDPLRVGDLTLPNRIIMAPLTRTRALEGRVPGPLTVEYYAQRASAGLILSEATSVDPMGVGYPDTPGIWSRAQVQAWKDVTQAVHAGGGRIFMQLWHVGRLSDPSFLDGRIPVAPSAIAPLGHVSLLRPKRDFVTPRALELHEISDIVAAFRKGAENAKEAGFDGVEIHGANGYLLDQFLQDGGNHRSDRYGGSIENRARLLLEVTDAAISVWGATRVGMHLSPRGDTASMGDSNPLWTFGYVARELGRRGVAFVFTREHLGDDRISPALKKMFGGVLIANEGFDAVAAQQELDSGGADAVAFGRLFISNPDLPRRLQSQAPLNTPEAQTAHGYGLPDKVVGYTDYPALPWPSIAGATITRQVLSGALPTYRPTS